MNLSIIKFKIVALLCLCMSFLYITTSSHSQNTTSSSNIKNISESNSLNPPCNCTITQGPNKYFLGFMTDTMSASEFYNYGVPNGSSSNTGLELSETMTIMLYEDLNTGDQSVIIIIDQANDGTGGAGSVTFNCLPSSAFVEFSDDGGELFGSPPTITGNYSWASCCTDGGIIGGVGCGVTMTIDPDFTSGIDLFSLLYGTPDNPIYVPMSEANCPIVIDCGGPVCCEELFEYSIDIQNPVCENDPTGYIDLTMDCSNEPIFTWSNGATTEDLIGITPGTYSVTMVDGYGCTAIEEFNIVAEFPNPDPVITGDNQLCVGEIGTLDAGGGFSSYEWSNGAGSQINFINSPGIYTVTVTNDGGCTAEVSYEVVEIPSIEPEISGPTEFCEGEVITIDAGGGFSSYEWSNGLTSQMVNITSGGDFSVTVTDANGCSNSDEITIDLLTAPSPIIYGSGTICENTSTILELDQDYSEIIWSTGEESPTIEISDGGLYEVTVTNSDGCLGSAFFVVTVNPSDSLTYFETSCNPQDTGVFINDYVNEFGCPSVAVTLVTYSDSDTVVQYDLVCSPQDTGVVIGEFVNQYGCDSINIKIKSLAPKDSLYYEIGVCNPLDTGIVHQNLINQYGCDSIVVVKNFLLPRDTIMFSEKSCDPEDEGLTIVSFTNQYGCDSTVITETTYTLVDTSFVYDVTCNPALVGIFEEQYTSSEGCDSLVILTIEQSPFDTIYLSSTTCDPQNVGVSEVWSIGQNGCDSLTVTNTVFVESDTIYLQAFTCDLNLAGETTEQFIGNGGCDSLVITNTQYVPADTSFQTLFTCDPSEVGTDEQIFVANSGCDSIVITMTEQLIADSIFVYNETCLPIDTGTIVNVYTNQLGCDSFVFSITTLAPPSECALVASIIEDTIGCQELSGSLWFEFENGTPPFTYKLRNSQGEIDEGIFAGNLGPFEIGNLEPGQYTIDLVDAYGYFISIQGEVNQVEPINSSLEIVSSYNGSDISCFGAEDGIANALAYSGGLPPFSYTWSNGDNSQKIENLSAGNYTVTITGKLGCTKVDSISLSSPNPLEINLEVNQPDCNTNGLGDINISQTLGGTAPYVYAIDNKETQSSTWFTSLENGTYQVLATDINGCQVTQSCSINNYILPEVYLGNDTIIEYGDSITITPVFNLNPSEFDWLEWQGIDCDNCVEVQVSPNQTSIYSLLVSDSLGCIVKDDIEIAVRFNYGIHYPNVFSPDNNGVNDYFTLFGGDNLRLIKELIIYDRWGGKMFSAYNIPANEPEYGWDGKFSGQFVNSGVYYFIATIEFADGKTRSIQGGITLLD